MAVAESASAANRQPLDSRDAGAPARPAALMLEDRLYFWLSTLVAACMLIVLAGIVAVLTSTAWPAITHLGLGFFTGTVWNSTTGVYGAVPFVVGTLITTGLALIIAVPISLGIALLLTEYLPGPVAAAIGIAIDVAAGVPTIVFGAWAYIALIPWLASTGEPALQAVLGWCPLFGTPSYHYLSGKGMLPTGIVLAAMIFPTIVSITRNSLVATPYELREASLGLGATRWETAWHVVLRQARTGALGAVVLACGRALGEAMAVIFIIGTVPKIPQTLFDVGDTLSSHILTQVLGAEPGSMNMAALYELGLLLLTLSVLTSLLGRALTRRLAGAASLAGVGR